MHYTADIARECCVSHILDAGDVDGLDLTMRISGH
jgi:hypothetical protein